MMDYGFTPGAVCDLFLLRRGYDDAQHGLKRKPKTDPAKAGLE